MIDELINYLMEYRSTMEKLVEACKDTSDRVHNTELLYYKEVISQVDDLVDSLEHGPEHL